MKKTIHEYQDETHSYKVVFDEFCGEVTLRLFRLEVDDLGENRWWHMAPLEEIPGKEWEKVAMAIVCEAPSGFPSVDGLSGAVNTGTHPEAPTSEAVAFKVGDRVRVARKVDDRDWMRAMDRTIGTIGEIQNVDGWQFQVSNTDPDDECGWWYPSEALELVKDAPSPKSSIYCDHANEVPSGPCRCLDDCYCKQPGNTCAPSTLPKPKHPLGYRYGDLIDLMSLSERAEFINSVNMPDHIEGCIPVYSVERVTAFLKSKGR